MSHSHGSASMDGMDMSTTDSTTSMMMMSTSFTPSLGAANLWFVGWTPATSGAMVGACVGLFFLALLSRGLAAFRAGTERAWAHAAVLERLAKERDGQADQDSIAKGGTSLASVAVARAAPPPPFRLTVDAPRAVLFTLHSAVNYFLMLAVMSYSVWFFVAILVGLGLGELAVGRYTAAQGGSGVHE